MKELYVYVLSQWRLIDVANLWGCHPISCVCTKEGYPEEHASSCDDNLIGVVIGRTRHLLSIGKRQFQYTSC